MKLILAAFGVLALCSCDGGPADSGSDGEIGVASIASNNDQGVAAEKFLPETGTVDLDGVESEPSLSAADEDKREGTSRPRQDNLGKKRTGG
jgi:hypothetical protein